MSFFEELKRRNVFRVGLSAADSGLKADMVIKKKDPA